MKIGDCAKLLLLAVEKVEKGNVKKSQEKLKLQINGKSVGVCMCVCVCGQINAGRKCNIQPSETEKRKVK